MDRDIFKRIIWNATNSTTVPFKPNLPEMINIHTSGDREIAEYVAKFRTPPGLNWKPLADDIETLLKMRPHANVRTNRR